MPIDARIPLGAGAGVTPLQSPFEAIGQVAQIEGVRAQTEARRLAAEEARQKAADLAAVRQILAETGGDMKLALPRLRQVAPKAALEFETEIQQAQNQKFQAATHQMAARQKGLEFAANMASLVVANPQSAPYVREHLAGISGEIETLLPKSDDPAEWRGFGDLALTAKERYEKSQANLKLFGEGKLQEALGGALSLAKTPEEWDQHIDGFLALGGAPEVAQLFGGKGAYSPENVTRAGQLAISPKDRATLAGTQAARDQTAAHQSVLEQQGAERIAVARQRLAQAMNAAAAGGQWTPRQITTFNQIAGAMDRSPLVRASDRTLMLHDAIAQIRKDPKNPVNQMALAYGFIQIADTYQSAVREGELTNITALATRMQQLQIEANKIYSTGAFMPEDLAKQIATTAEQMIASIERGRQQKIKEFGSRAKVSGVGGMWDEFIAGAGLGPDEETSTTGPARVRPAPGGGVQRPPVNPFATKK